MPEGPEIRIAADKIAEAIVDRPLQEVFFAFDRLKKFEKKLVGKRVESVDTRGKAMLIKIARGPTIYAHNQLYGRWYVRKAGNDPNTRRSLRVALRNDRNSALLYSASDVDVLDAKDIASHPFLSKIGPDILSSSLRASTVAKRLADSRFENRRLAGLLLDQSFLAGVGNYLRSEILFAARVNPLARPSDLDTRQRARLARAVLAISRRAYRTRGVTADPRSVAAARSAGLKRRDYRHFVFARAGKDCPECGACVEKISAGGRRCYVCADCQPFPAAP